MNILIPIGGKGLRFKDNGHIIPKPLIEVDGEPMVKKVIDNIKVGGNFIYVVRESHVNNYRIDDILNDIKSGEVFVLKGDNEGQAQTCLLAESSIDNDSPLFIVNCDNYFIWDHKEFQLTIDDEAVDGAVFTFKDPENKSHWCFAELGEGDEVLRLVEKDPISDVALAGGFYWRKGSDFVKYAKKMIEKNTRALNGEFYLGAVYNEAIQDNKRIIRHHIPDMRCMGTPEELDSFNKWIKNKIGRELLSTCNNITVNRNIQNAIDEIRKGKPIVLVDEHDRENEGDIVIAAELADVDNLVFTMNKGKGLMCVPAEGDVLDRLELPPMVINNTDVNQTPFTVSVDAAVGTTTGMSVHDRLATISILVDEDSKPEDLNRPGHLFPLRASDNLLKDRRGHTEGSVELMKLAGLKPIAIICEIMNDDGSMTKGPQLNKFAVENGLVLISIEELYEAIYNQSI